MEKDLLDLAVLKAFEYHKNQKRKFCDEPYVYHCLRVGSLVGDYSDDEELIMAGILHDTMEDTDATYNTLKELFGLNVANLVQELTNDFEVIKQIGKSQHMLDKFSNLSDGGLIIKSLDRLDNLTGLVNSKAPFTFIKKYVLETDFILENIQRPLLPVHTKLFHNLTFINNYIALTVLR